MDRTSDSPVSPPHQPGRGVGGAFVLGLLLALGLAVLGYLLAEGLLRFKALDRTVTVKGLAEREVAADLAIWPIKFTTADNDLGTLYSRLEDQHTEIDGFLREAGFAQEDLSISAPAIVDRKAQGYGDSAKAEFRYAGSLTVTVYSRDVNRVLASMRKLTELGRKGITLLGHEYGNRPEFLFTGLTVLKPAMIEEATRNARAVAAKFAEDSDSRLGKIRTANQGLFSIQDRDTNTPHVKKVRVVSTVVYYLVD